MRKYDPEHDRPVMLAAVQAGPCLADVRRAFMEAGLEWPILNPSDGKPTDYAKLVDHEICLAWEGKLS